MKLKLGDNLKGKIKQPHISFSWIRKIRSDALWGIAAYLHLLIVLPLIFKRKDQFVQYHIKQGIAVLFIWVLFLFSFFVPVLPWLFGFLLLVLILAGITNVIMSRERPLPLIGRIAERF